MKKIVYPGTFDPLTLGHFDIICRAAKLFDQVIIAVAQGHHKKTLLDFDTRVTLIKESVCSYSNIQVAGFDGLLVDFVQQHKAQAMVRGIRNSSDFDQELQFAMMNKELAGIDTLFLTPAIQFQFISSSLVREIFNLKGNIRPFVPENVAEYLHQCFKRD